MPTGMVPRYLPDDQELCPQALFVNGLAPEQVIWKVIT